MPEQLIGVTRSVNIKFVIKGPVGGLSSRSLLWFPTQISCADSGEVFSGLRVSYVADTCSACLVLHELGYSTPVECCLSM